MGNTGTDPPAVLPGLAVDDGSPAVYQFVFIGTYRLLSEKRPKGRVDLASGPVFCAHLRFSSLPSPVPGFPEKQKAAKELDVGLIVIRKGKRESGIGIEEAKEILEEWK